MSAHAHRAPHTHATSAHARHARTWSGATSSARRCPRNDIEDAHGRAGRRGRRPLPRTAPCPHTHIARRTRTPRPHTHAMRAPGRARRPRRDVAHGTTSGTPTCTRAAEDVGPYHVPHHTPMVGRDVLGAPLPTGRPRNDIGDAHGHAGRRDVGPYHALRHVRTRTLRAAHARHVRTRTACLPCQRIETLMGFRNAAAKSRTRACHAFASFTAPAPLQVAPAQ